MTINCRLTNKAIEDLDKLLVFGFLTYGRDAANLYYTTLVNKILELTEQPLVPSIIEDTHNEYRCCLSGIHSIYYRLDKEGVQIIRILVNNTQQEVEF